MYRARNKQLIIKVAVFFTIRWELRITFKFKSLIKYKGVIKNADYRGGIAKIMDTKINQQLN